MTELWLKFTDPDGVNKRVKAGRDDFVIGRLPDCDLAIADTRLSRKHAYIRRSGDRYLLEDPGSSNGTDLNGQPVFDPVEIRSGDVLSFGGFTVKAELEESATVAEKPVAAAAPARPAVVTPAASSSAPEPKKIPIFVFLLIPAIAGVLVIFAAGLVYMLVSRNDVTTTVNSDDQVDIDEPVNRKKEERDVTQVTNTPTTSDLPSGSNASEKPGDPPTNAVPANLSETAKVEINGAGFLRKIAQNDPKAFLTTEQAKRVNSKIKQLSGSSAVAENISSARKNASQIRSIATSKNLKPQLLGVAAIAKLGTSRGDVVASAQSMADVLDKLSVQLGNELADDCLLTIAAFDQGVAGDTMKMRNMLQDLANKSPESSRAIRTIWFLQKNGKISQGEFERALSFVAIGTIAQNPKEFGVNAEALEL